MRVKQTIILLLSILLFACSHKTSFEGQAWEKHSGVQAQGFDAEKLEVLEDYLDSYGETTAFVAIHKGKILYEYGDLSTVSYIASCRKSVLSILYGKHVETGTIDLNTTIAELNLDDQQGLLDIEKQATIDHLITSRSGVYHPASNGGYDIRFAEMRGQKTPGEFFVYNNWDFNVAGHVLEHYAGQSIYQEMEQQLAKPLGFQDWHIDNQKKFHKDEKSKYPAYHIYISTRDMAKIGQLMLQKGRWGNEQIVSKKWIEKIITPVTSKAEVRERYGEPSLLKPDFAYSYMWWNFDELNEDSRFEGAYLASGWGGQFITVIPKLDLVVAHKSKLNFLQLWGLIDGGVSNMAYYKMLALLVDAKYSEAEESSTLALKK